METEQLFKQAAQIKKVGLVRRAVGGTLHVEGWDLEGGEPGDEGFTVEDLELIMILNNQGHWPNC